MIYTNGKSENNIYKCNYTKESSYKHSFNPILNKIHKHCKGGNKKI